MVPYLHLLAHRTNNKPLLSPSLPPLPLYNFFLSSLPLHYHSISYSTPFNPYPTPIICTFFLYLSILHPLISIPTLPALISLSTRFSTSLIIPLSILSPSILPFPSIYPPPPPPSPCPLHPLLSPPLHIIYLYLPPHSIPSILPLLSPSNQFIHNYLTVHCTCTLFHPFISLSTTHTCISPPPHPPPPLSYQHLHYLPAA